MQRGSKANEIAYNPGMKHLKVPVNKIPARWGQFIAGIDPGKTGGISLLTKKDGICVASVKMPETEKEVVEFLLEYRRGISFVMIEKLQPMFKTSKVAMFKLGMNYGMLKGILTALELRWDEARPQEWQAAMKCLTKGNKNVSRAKAQRLFPNVYVTHANADSLLIAEHARRLRLHL